MNSRRYQLMLYLFMQSKAYISQSLSQIRCDQSNQEYAYWKEYISLWSSHLNLTQQIV